MNHPLFFGILIAVGAHAQTPYVEPVANQLDDFEGIYNFISSKSGPNWPGQPCPPSKIHVKQVTENSAPAIHLYSIDKNESEEWLDPDFYSFRNIGMPETGGGVWYGFMHMNASNQCNLANDGSVKRVQNASQFVLGIIPKGSTSGITTLIEKNGNLIYRRQLDHDLVVECKYKKTKKL